MKRIVITGAKGLIGWHVHVRLHAENCAARFCGEPIPFEIMALDHAMFDDDMALKTALEGADAVLHFAGVNRAGSDDELEEANPAIATRLANVCESFDSKPHIVYANSTHAANDTAYGRSKRIACEILEKVSKNFTNLILPHIFGEGALPRYNNVTATFIEAIIAGQRPDINPDGQVSLLHAGDAAQCAINAATECVSGILRPVARDIKVADLFSKIENFDTRTHTLSHVLQQVRNVTKLFTFIFNLVLYHGFSSPLPNLHNGRNRVNPHRHAYPYAWFCAPSQHRQVFRVSLHPHPEDGTNESDHNGI